MGSGGEKMTGMGRAKSVGQPHFVHDSRLVVLLALQTRKGRGPLLYDLRADPTTRLLEPRKDMVFPDLAGSGLFSAHYFHRYALPVIWPLRHDDRPAHRAEPIGPLDNISLPPACRSPDKPSLFLFRDDDLYCPT